MNKTDKIFVTGHRGLVGSAVVRELEKLGYSNIFTIDRYRCDLKDFHRVYDLWNKEPIDYVINCAGLVGGINANNIRGAEFLYENLMIQANVIEVSCMFETKKLIQLGSSCIYPRDCPQPIKEEYLMTSPLEETNMGYALAKITGLIMCKLYRKQYGSNFISCMPTNLYGINDNFNLETGHALPSIIHKLHNAKKEHLSSVEFWGTGTPRREFMFVDDLAEAVVFLMNNYDGDEHVNVGTGEDMTIREAIDTVSEIIGYKGDITFNTDKPDGTPQKLLDVTKLHALGWKHKTSFDDGIRATYKWFVKNYTL